MMSTEHDFDIGSEQYSFLKDHLEKVDRSVTPWLIFTGHRSHDTHMIHTYNCRNVSGVVMFDQLMFCLQTDVHSQF